MNRHYLLFTAVFTLTALFRLTSAQLSTKEILKNATYCDLSANHTLDCGSDSIIAVHSLQYAYNVSCERTCCPYNENDCIVDASKADIKDVTRVCSGKPSCLVPINTKKTDFTTCSLGVKDISYVHLQYYCIARKRVLSICSDSQLSVPDDRPVYLTNENYPEVTSGSTSCSCSFEVFSCTSKINIYTIDADLYLDTDNCEQTLNFLDTDNKSLSAIGCEEYYKTKIESSMLDSHYMSIDFINNSSANQEGYFFLGLDSSEEGTTSMLTCSSRPAAWCIGCGSLPSISNGNITLSFENDFSFRATANVTCDSGYKTDTPSISCQANGTWPEATCTEKPPCSANEWRCSNGECILNTSRCDIIPDCDDESDEQDCKAPVCPEGLEFCKHVNGSDVCVDEGINCGCDSVPSINNGMVSPDVNSTIGSVANVTCKAGYDPSRPFITCLITGSWELVTCVAKDYGPLPMIDFGQYKLVNVTSTVFGSSANVICYLGYTSNNQSITCQSSGQWETAICTVIVCGPLPTLDFGQYKLVNAASTVFGSSANVICHPGYTSNKQSITCQSSGQWETAICTVIDCGPLPTLDFGQYKLVNVASTVFGSSANVICYPGYTSNNQSITCQSSGLWETAVCTVIDCGPLPTLDFGQYKLVNAASTVFGSSANVICYPGYTSNKQSITCQSSGQWETAICTVIGSTTPGYVPIRKKDMAIIIAVIVLGLIILLQCLCMCYFQCKIHKIRKTAGAFVCVIRPIKEVTVYDKNLDGDPEVLKRICMTLLGSFPLFGLIPIYITWKEFYREVYKVSHERHPNKKERTAPDGASNPNADVPDNHKKYYPTDEKAHTTLSGIELEHKTPEANMHIESEKSDGPQTVPESTQDKLSSTTDDKTPIKRDWHQQREGKHQDVENKYQDREKKDLDRENKDLDIEVKIEHEEVKQGEMPEEHRDNMIRGISAVFNDRNDDMALGPRKNRLPPIQQHYKEQNHADHRHHHFSTEVEKERKRLQPKLEEARKQGHRAELYRDRLIIDNCLYDSDTFKHEDVSKHLHAPGQRADSKHKMFY